MLQHEFLIKTTQNNLDCEENIAIVDDDLMLYIINSFNLLYIINSFNHIVTTWNNDKNKRKGLNYYGYTWIIDKVEFQKTILNWKEFFTNSSNKIVIKQNLHLLNKINLKTNRKNFVLDKNRVIFQLEKLLELINIAISKNLYFLHLGI